MADLLKLRPRVYAKNSKLTITAKNKYSTVHMKLVENEVEETPAVIATQEIKNVKINDKTFTLPLGDDVAPTFVKYMYNKYKPWSKNNTYGKARIEVTMAFGTYVQELSTPFVGTPTASVSLGGFSYSLDSLAKSFDELPDYGSLTSTGFASWISSNCNKKLSFSRAYDTETVHLNPWVNGAPISTITQDQVDVLWVPTDADDHRLSTYAYANNWTNACNDYTLSDGYKNIKIQDMPDRNDVYHLFLNAHSTRMYASVEVLSDTKIRVSWAAPVRYAYMAASQCFNLRGQATDVDNKIYMDVVDSISIQVSAFRRSTNTTDYYKSYNHANNQFSESPGSDCVYLFPESELLTTSTYYNNPNILWPDVLSNIILTSSHEGKYIFECEVPASWAIDSGVQINTWAYVYLQNGEMVRRSNKDIKFLVTNITKKYTQGQFIYRLKLIEK